LLAYKSAQVSACFLHRLLQMPSRLHISAIWCFRANRSHIVATIL
jgi:hypothetical protein